MDTKLQSMIANLRTTMPRCDLGERVALFKSVLLTFGQNAVAPLREFAAAYTLCELTQPLDDALVACGMTGGSYAK